MKKTIQWGLILVSLVVDLELVCHPTMEIFPPGSLPVQNISMPWFFATATVLMLCVAWWILPKPKK